MKKFLFLGVCGILSSLTGFADNCSEERVLFGGRVEAAEKVIERTIDVERMPRPRASEYTCMGSSLMAQRDFEQNHQAEIFDLDLNNAENETLSSLQASERAATVCGFEAAYRDVVSRVIIRKNIKANALARLIQQEKNHPQYQGIITTMLKTAYQREVSGDGNGTLSKHQAKMMSLELLEFSMDELKTKHDFRYDLTEALKVAHVAIELGGITTDEVIKKVEQLLRFKVEIEGAVEVDLDGEQISYESRLTTPLFSAKFSLAELRFHYEPNPADFSFKGRMDVDDGSALVSPNAFQTPVDLDVRACELVPSVKVKVLKFGPPREQWKLCADGECHSFPVPTTMQSLVHMALAGQYLSAPHDSGDPWYVFEVTPFKNLQKVIGERTFEGQKTMDEMVIDAEYSFKIEHNP